MFSPPPTPTSLLCLRCGVWSDPPEGATACPSCGGTGSPASANEMVEVRITWHELRVLTIWAERWANLERQEDRAGMLKVVYGIADRLQSQYLDRPGLTFASEIAELRAMLGPNNVEVHGLPDGVPDEEPPA